MLKTIIAVLSSQPLQFIVMLTNVAKKEHSICYQWLITVLAYFCTPNHRSIFHISSRFRYP